MNVATETQQPTVDQQRLIRDGAGRNGLLWYIHRVEIHPRDFYRCHIEVTVIDQGRVIHDRCHWRIPNLSDPAYACAADVEVVRAK